MQIASAAPAQTDLSDYAAGDKFFWYDGYTNSQDGHNGNAAVWSDLSGNGKNATMVNATWGGNYCYFSGDTYGYTPTIDFGLASSFTYEICFGYVNTNDLCILAETSANPNNHAGAFYNTVNQDIAYSPDFYFNGASRVTGAGARYSRYPSEIITATFVLTSEGGTTRVLSYRNGELVETYSAAATFALATEVLHIGEREGGTFRYSGNMYSLRMYSGALSAAQIAANYKTDAVRFDTDNYYASHNLIAMYDAEDNTAAGHNSQATVWQDISGNGNDIALQNVTWGDNYAYFNGTNAVGRSQNVVNMGGTTKFTLEMSFGYVASTTCSVPIETSQNAFASSNIGAWFFALHNDNQIDFLVNNATSKQIMGGLARPITENNITVSCVYDGSKTSYSEQIKLYVNGELQTARFTRADIAQMALANFYLYVGGRNLNELMYKGNIYSIRMYNKALTANEVAVNFATDSARFLDYESYVTDNMVVWYDGEFNNYNRHASSSSVWNDISNNGNDLNLSNVSFGGKYASFNGSNSYGSTGSVVDFKGTSKFTMEVALTNIVTSDTRLILETGTDANTYVGSMYLAINQDIMPDLCIKHQSGIFRTCSANQTTLTSGVTTLTYVYDATASTAQEQMKIYINGVLQSLRVGGGSISSQALVNYVLYVGSRANRGLFFGGNMYAIRMYTAALSSAEIANNANVDAMRFRDYNTYKVDGDNVSISAPQGYLSAGSAYNATVTPSAGYVLPESIKVLSGGVQLAPSSYSWNQQTGALSIPAASITGNLAIIIKGVYKPPVATAERTCSTYYAPVRVDFGASDSSMSASLYGYQYKIGDGAYTNGSFATLSTDAASGTYTLTLYVRAVDTKGNTSADVAYTYNFDRNLYTITYNCGENGANNASNPSTYNVETPNITFGDPNRAGFTFNGWYKEPTYSTPINGIPTQSQGNVSAYANYTLDSLAVPETSASVEKSYDAETETLTCTPSHSAVAKSFTYQWYKGGSAIQNAITDSYTVKNVADSGSYTCAVSVSSDGQSSTATTSPITVAISRRAVTVNANAINKTYGEALVNTFDYQTTNLVGGEALTGTLSCTPIQAADTYPITQGSITNENNLNYDITFNGADYTIAKYVLTVTATAVNKIYGEDLLSSFDYTITKGTLQNSDTALVGALACETLTQAFGDYEITQGSLTNDSNKNYDITYEKAIYRIAKYALTVTATAVNKTYGENLLTSFAYAITEGTLQNSDTALVGALACPTLTQAFGDYEITQGSLTNENNKNYNITYEKAIYRITKYALTVTATPINKIYGEELLTSFAYTITKGTLQNNDTALNGALACPTLKQAFGDYPIMQGSITNENNVNYTITYEDADYSIAKKGITGATVTLGTALTYNGAEQTQTVESVVIDELPVTYDLTDNKGTNATGYTLTITATGNFTGTITKDFSIAKKNITGATVTLGASLTYNGEEQTQTVTSVVIDDLAVTYDLSDNKAINATADTAYTLTIKANGNFTGTITKDFSIAKKDIAGATVTLGAVLTYNGEEQTQTVTSVVIDELTVTYDLSDNKAINATADTAYTLTIKANGNFTGTITKGFSIAKKDITDATVTLGASLTYNGEEQTQTVESVVIDDLTVTYDLSDNKAKDATEDTAYTLTIKANGNFTGTITKDFSIAKKAITGATVTLGDSLTYNGEEQTQTVESVVIDELTVTYDLSNNKGTNATEDTSYTLTIKANGNFTGTVTKDFSIAKKDITGATVTLGASLTYNGEEQTQTVTSVVIDELTVTYVLSNNKATTATIDTNYTLTITANGNFTGVVTKEYSIARAEYDMSLVEYNNVQLTYTGSSRYPTVDESTLPRGKDGYKVEVTYKGGAKDVADGVQTVTATFSTRSTNYNAPAAKTATIKILPIALKVTIADKSSVYGEELKKLTASVKDGYSLAKGENIDVLKLKLTKAVGLTVNTYAITGKYENANYLVEFENGTYSITEKAITLNIASKSSVYGDNLVNLTATLDESSAFAYEDTLETLSYTLSKANGLAVDTYAITGADTDNNYDIDFVDGSYEITARPTTVTATAINKTYGDTLVTSYSYSATNLVPGEALSGSLACNVLQAYGTYPITQGTLTNANNTNYNITYYGANYDIAKYALTVTATAINKTYGDNLLTTYGYTITEGELQNSDTALSGTLACPTLVQAYGTYPITQGTLTNENNVNYNITYYGANYDIAKYTYAVVASGLTKVYGESDSALTENRTLLLGDTVTLTYTREQGENAGNYDLLTVAGDNTNYDLTFDLAQNADKFVITPYALSVTASYYKKGIGKSDPSLTETIDGVNGEKVAVTYTREDGEQSGDYDLLTVTTANGNYTVSFAAGGNIARFTINKKILVIRADAVSLTYGDALPTLTATVTGFAEGDGYEYISGTLRIATDYKQYDGALSITPNDMSLIYGEKLTGVTLSYAGFVGADTAETLSGGYRIVTDYKEGLNIGTYALNVSNTLKSDNYAITLNTGTLIVTCRALTVRIADISSNEGMPLSGFKTEITSGTLAAKDIKEDVGIKLTTDAVISVAGDYAITGTYTNLNYDVTFVNGVYTVISKNADLKEVEMSVPDVLKNATHIKVSIMSNGETTIKEVDVDRNGNIQLLLREGDVVSFLYTPVAGTPAADADALIKTNKTTFDSARALYISIGVFAGLAVILALGIIKAKRS